MGMDAINRGGCVSNTDTQQVLCWVVSDVLQVPRASPAALLTTEARLVSLSQHHAC